MKSRTPTPDRRKPDPAPFPQGADTSEAVSGGPEDLMVQDRGGTLPLKKSETPRYYPGTSPRKKTPD